MPKSISAKTATNAEMKKLILRINAEGGRALKMLAAEKDTSMVALAVEAFNDLLKKHGKRPVVANPLTPKR